MLFVSSRRRPTGRPLVPGVQTCALPSGPRDYRMVDDGRVKSMTYKVVGKDEITIAGKAHTATKVSNRDGDKETIAWVVDGMPMPVRILQRKDGKDEIDLRIQSVQ